MKVACSHCGEQYEIEAEFIGQSVKCNTCGNRFTVENPNLFPCPDCFAKISKRASICPHCGAPVNEKANSRTNSNNEPEKTVFIGHPATVYYCLSILIGILLLPFIVGIIILIDVIINIHCTVYQVTSKRVLVKTGWLNKRQIEIWIKDMRGVNIQQDIWQRFIGTASVAIGTAATAGTEIQMHGLRNAQEIVDQINSLR